MKLGQSGGEGDVPLLALGLQPCPPLGTNDSVWSWQLTVLPLSHPEGGPWGEGGMQKTEER